MNIETMQSRLDRQMALLDSGKGDTKRANAMCNLVGKFIGTVRLQLDYAKALGIIPSIPIIRADGRQKQRRIAKK